MERLLRAACMIVLLAVAVFGRASVASSPPTTKVDPKALALLDKVQAKLLSIKTLSADWSYLNHYVYQGWDYNQAQSGTIELKKPNFAIVSAWRLKRKGADAPWQKDYLEDLTVSDGHHQWFWDAYDDGINPIYAVKPNGENVLLNIPFPIDGFFNPDQGYAAKAKKSIRDGSTKELRDTGTAMYEGQAYHILRWVHINVVKIHGRNGKVVSTRKVTVADLIFIGSDSLIHRMLDTSNNVQVDDMRIENIHLNAPIADSSFAFKAPPGPLRPIPQQKPDGREKETL